LLAGLMLAKRQSFLRELIDQNFFWSYDLNPSSVVKEELVIEHVLKFGDVPYLKKLFEFYDFNKIKEVWMEELAPDKRYRKLNTYLGKFFFKIEDIDEFLNSKIVEYPRLEKFKKLIADDPEGIGQIS